MFALSEMGKLSLVDHVFVTEVAEQLVSYSMCFVVDSEVVQHDFDIH
jgi:hypothetical protein